MKILNNPIATNDQKEHEILANEVFHEKEVINRRKEIRAYWLDLVKPSETMLSCFDDAFNEVMFGAVIWGLNQDPSYPKVITISRVAHKIKNISIPGSRWGIDNPDSVYRVIPISNDQSYVIRGKLGKQQFNENHFTLWDDDMKTIGLISGNQIVADQKGNFEITVDSKNSSNRKNHIQTSKGAKEFYIRDTIIDWQNDRPNFLDVKNISQNKSNKPFSKKKNIEIVKKYMKKWAFNTTRWNQQALSKPENEFSFRIDRDTDGALRNQVYLMGHFNLPSRDHCINLEIFLDGAQYFIAPITNIWGTTNEIMKKNGSLNNHQSKINDTGTYSFILSQDDPGIHNWLDPSGLNQGILTLRWSGFPNGLVGKDLYVKSEVMLIEDAKKNISKAQLILPEEREEQLQKRARSYSWRIED